MRAKYGANVAEFLQADSAAVAARICGTDPTAALTPQAMQWQAKVELLQQALGGLQECRAWGEWHQIGRAHV